MSLVLLSDVKAHLRIASSDNDVKLQGFLDSAETALSKRLGGTGTFASTSVTERCAGRGAALALNYKPVISVASVTGAWGDALSLTDLDVDKQNGLINFYPFSSFPFIEPWYSVAYTTGYASLAAMPSDVVLAVKELTEHLFDPQRGAAMQPGYDQPPPAGYALPNRVLELISPYVATGFA